MLPPRETVRIFSAGPRNCVGQNLTMVSIRLVVATLMSRFTFELAPEAGGRETLIQEQTIAVTLVAPNGVPIKCRLNI